MDAPESTMGGVGTIGRKAKVAELKAQEPILVAEIEIRRAAAGAVEHYTLIGTPIEHKE